MGPRVIAASSWSPLLFSMNTCHWAKEQDSHTPGSPFEGIPRRKFGSESSKVPRMEEPLGHEFGFDSLMSSCKLMEYL